MQKNHLLLVKKVKNTGSAQLWKEGQREKEREGQRERQWEGRGAEREREKERERERDRDRGRKRGGREREWGGGPGVGRRNYLSGLIGRSIAGSISALSVPSATLQLPAINQPASWVGRQRWALVVILNFCISKDAIFGIVWIWLKISVIIYNQLQIIYS